MNLAKTLELRAFDPNEPRDKDGKWGSGGAGGGRAQILLPQLKVKGAVVEVGGQYFKIAKNYLMKEMGGYRHDAIPATQAQYTTRMGRIQLQGVDVPPYRHELKIGSVVKNPETGEFLYVKSIDRLKDAYGSGYRSFAVGNYVSADKAVALQKKWDDANRERLRQQEALRRSQSDDARDFG